MTQKQVRMRKAPPTKPLGVLLLIQLLVAARFADGFSAFVARGTGRGKVASTLFRSFNNGETWEEAPLPASFVNGGTTLSAMVADTSQLQSVGSGGSLLMPNASSAWLTTGEAGSALGFSTISFVNLTCIVEIGDIVLVGGQLGVVLRSVDSGASFNQVTIAATKNINDFSVEATARDGSKGNLTTVFAAGDVGLILYSADSGASWTIRSVGTSHNLLCVAALSPDIAVVAGQAGTVLRTSNGGITWTALTIAALPTQVPPVALLGCDAATVQLGFSTTLIVLGGARSTLVYSNDEGNTWLGGQYSGLTQEASDGTITTVFDSSDPVVVAQGELNDRHLSSVTLVDRQLGFITTRGRYLATTDGGVSWRSIAMVYENGTTITEDHLMAMAVVRAGVFSVPDVTRISANTGSGTHEHSVTILNRGTADLVLTGFTSSDTRMVVASAPYGTGIAPGATASVVLRIQRSEFLAGVFQINVSMFHQAPRRQDNISVTLSVTSPVAVSTSAWIEDNWWVILLVSLVVFATATYFLWRTYQRRLDLRQQKVSDEPAWDDGEGSELEDDDEPWSETGSDLPSESGSIDVEPPVPLGGDDDHLDSRDELDRKRLQHAMQRGRAHRHAPVAPSADMDPYLDSPSLDSDDSSESDDDEKDEPAPWRRAATRRRSLANAGTKGGLAAMANGETAARGEVGTSHSNSGDGITAPSIAGSGSGSGSRSGPGVETTPIDPSSVTAMGDLVVHEVNQPDTSSEARVGLSTTQALRARRVAQLGPAGRLHTTLRNEFGATEEDDDALRAARRHSRRRVRIARQRLADGDESDNSSD